MAYTLDEKNIERQCLLGEHLKPFTLSTLRRISLPRGARILDVGCGIGETSALIAACFPDASITGIDQDEELLEVARSRAQYDGVNSTYIKGNAAMLPFDTGSFDFVFTRYLLIHVDDPFQVLNEMKRVGKQGATLYAQEPDACLLYCHPDSFAYNNLRNWFHLLFPDALMGRKLESYFKSIGIRHISINTSLPFEMTDRSTIKRLYTLTAESIGPALIKRNIISEDEFSKCILEFRRVENEQTTFLLANPSIAATGIIAAE